MDHRPWTMDDGPYLPAVRRQRLWPPVTEAKASASAGGDHGGGVTGLRMT